MGKLYLLDVTNMNSAEIVNIKYKMFIVRSCKNDIYYRQKGWYIVPTLSPSPQLFQRYLSLRKDNNWNINTFNSIYVPQFKEQMKIDLAMKRDLNAVLALLKAGHDVAFMCYCQEDVMCHRYILGEAYKIRGIEVIKI